jgi:hypothetical protein
MARGRVRVRVVSLDLFSSGESGDCDVLLGASEHVQGDSFLRRDLLQAGRRDGYRGVVGEVVVFWLFPVVHGAWGWAEGGALCLRAVGTRMGRYRLEAQSDFPGVRSSAAGIFIGARKSKISTRELGRGESASSDRGGAWFLRFVNGGSSDGPCFAKTRRSGNDVRRSCGNVG